jgi:hypothetical protein
MVRIITYRFVVAISGGRGTGTGGRHQARPVLSTACILLRSCLMNDAVAANRLAGSMVDLLRAATRFLTEMTTEPPVFLPIAA